MIWEPSEVVYVEYQEALSYFLRALGLTQLDHRKNREVLYPYYLQYIKYMNWVFINETEDNIKAKIEKVLEISDLGSTYICTKEPEDSNSDLTLDWAQRIGVEVDSDHFDKDRFVFSWSDFMSTLCLRLKFQYAHLFAQEVDDSCGCKCGKGQTEEDYESWVSGVYPQDEEYDRTNYYRVHSNWGVTEDRLCDCYKKNQ